MTNRGTYLHLCFFSNVCNISVKQLMYMRTSCILCTKIYSSIRVFVVHMVSKIGLFLLCKSGSCLFGTGWSYSSERLFNIEGRGRS